MIKTFDLSGKVILFTGGYGYLGKAAVDSLAFHGAKVYVLGRNEETFLNRFSSKEQVLFEQADISSTKSISEAFLNIHNAEGKIDILVNNAFYLSGQSPEEMEDKEFSDGIEGTLNSVFKCIREIIPYFKKAIGGKIINVSSMYGMVAPDFEVYEHFPEFLNPPHYGAAKAGVIQLTKYYASYLGKLGINVNAITPGPFPSEKVQVNEGFVRELENRTLLRRIGTPEDLAGAFVFLSSDASNYITGQNIVVDGGWTSK